MDMEISLAQDPWTWTGGGSTREAYTSAQTQRPATHRLRHCFTCTTPLAQDADVFMAMDNPFCSINCRDWHVFHKSHHGDVLNRKRDESYGRGASPKKRC